MMIGGFVYVPRLAFREESFDLRGFNTIFWYPRHSRYYEDYDVGMIELLGYRRDALEVLARSATDRPWFTVSEGRARIVCFFGGDALFDPEQIRASSFLLSVLADGPVIEVHPGVPPSLQGEALCLLETFRLGKCGTMRIHSLVL